MSCKGERLSVSASSGVSSGSSGKSVAPEVDAREARGDDYENHLFKPISGEICPASPRWGSLGAEACANEKLRCFLTDCAPTREGSARSWGKFP